MDKFTVEVTFSQEIMDRVEGMSDSDRAYYLENKIEDGLEGGYYDNVVATYIHQEPEAFVADDDYVAMVKDALETINPNATDNPDFQEIWDDEAIQRLANYLKANDYDQSDVIAQYNMLYAMYDMLKWTEGNK